MPVTVPAAGRRSGTRQHQGLAGLDRGGVVDLDQAFDVAGGFAGRRHVLGDRPHRLALGDHVARILHRDRPSAASTDGAVTR